MYKPSVSKVRSVVALAIMFGLTQAIWLVGPALAVETQQGEPARPAKKAIGHDAYAGWNSLQGTVISKNGEWLAYALVPQEDDGAVVFVHLADGKEWRAPRGLKPVFSADGRYAAFEIKPTRAELELARKNRKTGENAPKSGMGWIDLASGKTEQFDKVKQFAFPQSGGNQLAVLLEPPIEKKNKADDKAEAERNDDLIDSEAAADQSSQNPAPESKKKSVGSSLILLDLGRQSQQRWEQVGSFSWAKNGSLLAFAISSQTAADSDKQGKPAASIPAIAGAGQPGQRLSPGVYGFRPQAQQLQTLLSGKYRYLNLSVADNGQQLAFLVLHPLEPAPANASEPAIVQNNQQNKQQDKPQDKQADEARDKQPPVEIAELYYWQQGDQAASLLVDQKTAGMPAGWGVSEYGGLSFSKDGQRLELGTAALPKPVKERLPELVKVDLWHWKDPQLQSVQKASAEADRHRHYSAIVWLAQRRFVQLATVQMPDLSLNDNPHYALGSSKLPYQMLSSWDGDYRDLYAVDLTSGKAVLLAKRRRFAASLSPAGKYVLAFDAASSQWQAWRTSDASQIELSKNITTALDNQLHDTPEPHPAYGMAGWTRGDEGVVVYDEFDLWKINPETLVATNLTGGEGRRRQLQLRYQKLDEEHENKPAEEDAVPVHKQALPVGSWILSGLQKQTKVGGLYRLPANRHQPEPLLSGDAIFSKLMRVGQSNQYVYTRESFSEFPDLWLSDKDFQQQRRLSDANPQQAGYQWGSQQLIAYTTADGQTLQGLLAKPENFDPSRKYPLMVYIYERFSDNLNRYIAPAPSQNINVMRYVSNGYLVLRPDIAYQTGHPGQSALKAVTAAVNQLVAQGFVDPARIGIQGHSWGAYQINYLLTQTNMFRAAEAGASMADMVSGYGGLRWGKGVSRAFQYETGQSRIGGTPWNKTAEYLENSPIFYVDRVQTPYLTIHNDDDDAVPWYQAIEFFTALRRLGKEAYWFNYNGEKHGLKNRENIKHYTVHMAEFFDHFLLGKARPDWMETPTPYLERGQRDVSPLFKTPAPAGKPDN